MIFVRFRRFRSPQFITLQSRTQSPQARWSAGRRLLSPGDGPLTKEPVDSGYEIDQEIDHISDTLRNLLIKTLLAHPFGHVIQGWKTFDRDTIYLHLYLEQLDVYGKNARRMRVKYTYRDLYDILKALLSGRDEQFVGILVKGYHITPQIPVHLRSVH